MGDNNPAKVITSAVNQEMDVENLTEDEIN
jgi:hypothetical protein